MKKIHIIYGLLIGLFATSCSDTTDPVIGNTTASVLNNLPSNDYILTEEDETEIFAQFSWSTASYGLPVAISYELQMDKAGNSFASPATLASTTDQSLTITVGDMNKQMIKLEYPAGQVAAMEFRVVSSITSAVYESAVSNVIQANITPYEAEKVYPMMYTPGNHQGWAPDKAAPIYSISDVNLYEGYVYLDGGFKVTSAPNWDGTNYGAGAAAGTLSATGSDLTASAGYYYLKADIGKLTYSLKPMAWGVIGSATPTGWDSDTKLVYDSGTMTLRVDIKLTDGEIKFRANSDWADNLGGSLDMLTPGGDNIKVTAGNYTLVLDLSKPIYKTQLIAK